MERTRSTKFPDVLLEEKFQNFQQRITDVRDVVHSRYNETDKKLDTNKNEILADLAIIKKQVAFTNGKVRRIIIALVLAFGLIIGLGFDKLSPVLAIILGG